MSGDDIQQKEKVHIFGLAERPLTQFSPLERYPDFPIRKTLMRKLTVILLKRVSESIFFQSNKFTAYKVKDEKEVTNILIVLLISIRKHLLRT